MATYDPRFGNAPNEDPTGRILNYGYDEPVYAASVALAPNAYETVLAFAQLTGAMTVTASLTRAKVGDKIIFLFNSDATPRVVTFGTGFSPTATLSVTASKRATAVFIFDGVSFVEQSRAVSA